MIWKIKTSLLNILLLGSCLHKIQKKCSLNKDMKSQLVTQKKAKKLNFLEVIFTLTLMVPVK